MTISSTVGQYGNIKSWPIVSMRSFLRQSKRTGGPGLPLLGVSLHEGVRKRFADDGRPAPSEDMANYKVVEPGDVIMNRLGKPHGSVGVSPLNGITSPAYWVMSVDRAKADPRFVHHLLRSRHLIDEYTRLGKFMPPNQFDITWEVFRNIEVPLPSLEEQRRIADFLDTETVRIDTVAKIRQRSRDLLDELAITQIDNLVRGTSSSDRIMADFAALGLVPRDWMQCRLRSIECEIQTGPFGSQLHAKDYVENGWPVINPANISAQGLKADSRITVDDVTRKRLNRHVLHSGDVVFGRRGDLGRAGVVVEDQQGWVCGTGCLRVRFQQEKFHPGYLRRYLSIPAVRHYFLTYSVGSTMANLNSRILYNMPLLAPEFSEQERISDACEALEARHLASIAAIGRQLALLMERRQALITAAVTGQIDVTTVRGVV